MASNYKTVVDPNAGIADFEKEIDDFVRTFPRENISNEKVRQLLNYLNLVATNFTNGPRAASLDNIGSFAERIHLPVTITTHPYGPLGLMRGMVKEYQVTDDVREIVEKALRQADEKLVPLGLMVAEKQLPKPREVWDAKFPEINAFMQKQYPEIHDFSAKNIYEFLTQQVNAMNRASLLSGKPANPNKDIAQDYLAVAYRCWISQTANIKTIDGAMDFLDVTSKEIFATL